MKTTMKVSGLVSLILLGVATVFKIFHWPGAGIGLVLGFFILGFLFLPSALYVNFRDGHKKKNLLLHLIALFGGIIFLAGILFKLMHWPGASVALLLGSASLLLVFLPVLLFVNLKKAKSKNEKVAWIVGVIAVIIFQMATLFKIMHWPGAMMMMIAGSVLLISVFLPIYSISIYRETGKITGRFIYLIILSMFAILFTFLISINVSRDIIAHMVRQSENANLVLTYLEGSNASKIAEYNSYPDNMRANTDSVINVVKNASDEMCSYINELKIQLIRESEGVNDAVAKEMNNDTKKIISKDRSDISMYLMLGPDMKSGKATELRFKLEKFKEVIVSVTDKSEIKMLIEDALSTKDDISNGMPSTWENTNFMNRSIMSTLTTLTYLEIFVREAESFVLSSALKGTLISERKES